VNDLKTLRVTLNAMNVPRRDAGKPLTAKNATKASQVSQSPGFSEYLNCCFSWPASSTACHPRTTAARLVTAALANQILAFCKHFS
jgi:hypothetical protein